jgi:hypothetical protein
MANKGSNNDELAGFDADEESLDEGSWLTRAQAAKRLDVTVTTIRRWEKEGKLQGKNVNGTFKFPASSVAAMTGEEDMSPQAIIDAAVHGMQVATKHVEALVGLITAPIAKLVEGSAAEAVALRERVAKLEDKNFAMLQDAEKAASLAHERELATKMFEMGEARKNAALGELMKYSPKLLGLIGQKWLAGPAPTPAAGSPPALHGGQPTAKDAGVDPSVAKLIQSLTGEQIATLVDTLTPEQMQHFQTIVDKMAGPEPPAEKKTAAPVDTSTADVHSGMRGD